MALVTVADLKTQALDRADMRYSNYIASDELTSLINASAQELYDILTGVYEDYYFLETNFSIANGASTFTLPDDFYKLRGVDEVINNQFRVTVKPYEWIERNMLIQPNGFRNLLLSWIPKMTPLVNDTDTFDGINGYEQYIVSDVARKIVMKEESDVQPFLIELAAVKQRINDMAKDRNAGDSSRIGDVYRQDAYIMYAYPQRLRYRIQGNELKFLETNFYGNVYA